MPTSLIAAAIAAGGSYLASKTAADASDKAAQTQMNVYNLNKKNIKPWITEGGNALTKTGDATGLNGNDAQSAYYANFQNDPFYKGIMASGQNSIENSALARGHGYGGNVLSDLNRYSMDTQRQAYNDRYNQLSGISQQGLTGANALAGVGTLAANNAGQFNSAAGAYNGAGIMNGTNALTNAINTNGFRSGMNSAFGNYFNPV